MLMAQHASFCVIFFKPMMVVGVFKVICDCQTNL